MSEEMQWIVLAATPGLKEVAQWVAACLHRSMGLPCMLENLIADERFWVFSDVSKKETIQAVVHGFEIEVARRSLEEALGDD